jgi:hypothetical protein
MYWLSFGVQRELTFVTKDEKEKPHAKAWKHDVAIAGLQYDLRVLSSVHVVRIIRDVVRS